MSSSSRSSKHTPLLPFPAVSDPQEQVLCGVLRVQPYEAQLLLLACPAVSTMPAADLAANWQLLQQLLPLPQQKLLQAMLQIPSLLAHPKKTVHARLAESAKVLGLSVGQLKARRREQTAQLQWRLLVTPRQQLEQQLVQVVQLLGGLQQQQVVRLVCAEPKLLGRDPAQLLSTVEALEQVTRHGPVALQYVALPLPQQSMLGLLLVVGSVRFAIASCSVGTTAFVVMHQQQLQSALPSMLPCDGCAVLCCADMRLSTGQAAATVTGCAPAACGNSRQSLQGSSKPAAAAATQ